MRTRIRRALQVVVLIPLLSTCGGSDGGGGDQTPSRLAVVLAPPATVQNGVTFPVEIQVAAADGSPVDAPGIPVTLAVTGGRTLGGTTTVNTGADGVAQFNGLSLTGAVGLVQLTATAPSLTQVTTANFGLGAGPAFTILPPVVLPPPLTVRAYAAPGLSVRVLDAGGNAVAGATLSIQVVGGGGDLDSMSSVTTRNVITNGTGYAAIGVWRMGATVGPNRLQFTVPSVPAVPAETVTVFSKADALWAVQILNDVGSEVEVGTVHNAPFRARSQDQFGNAIPGVSVQFSMAPGWGGSMTGTDGTTDSLGIYTLGSWTVGTKAWVNHVIRVSHAGEVMGQTDVYGLPGSFSRVVAVTPVVDRLRSTTTEVEFTTVDRYGNGVQLVHVEGTIVSGGGTFFVGGESQFAGEYKPSYQAPATADSAVLRVWSPLAPDSSADVIVHVKAPVAMLSIGPDSQTIVAGDSLPVPFQIKVVDASGDPVAGVPVGSTSEYNIASASGVTDSAGLFLVRPYPEIGIYRLTLFGVSPWLPADSLPWVIRTVVGPPAQLIPQCCAVPSGVVGDTLAVGPTVKVADKYGFTVIGAPVHFAVQAGSIIGSDTLSDSSGMATPTGVVLDTIAGLQVITATTPGVAGVPLPVRGLPGPISALVLLPGASPEGFAGERLAIGIRVEGRDRYGNLGVGREVTQSTVSNAVGTALPVALDSLGQAYLDGWTLGATPGTAELLVVADHDTIDFNATVQAASPFFIYLRGVPPEFDPVFRGAAYRWRRRITGDIPDLNNVTIPAGTCAPFQQALNGAFVDDLIIDVSIQEIDGPGAILGAAGPCFIRTSGGLPLLGAMQFDIQDLAMLRAQGTLGDVILHEMGHVLGIGSLWSGKNLLTGAGTINPTYTGAGGEQGWAEIGGTGSVAVPVENTGGQGTADSHWRETSMPSELMTGYLSALVNPMSLVTVRSLGDLGYVVDPATADAYTAFTAPRPAPGVRGVRIQDRVMRPTYTVDPDGKARPIE